MRSLLWVAIMGLCSTPLLAASPHGFSFAHKDWELACDNTGTCRAAGYGATAGEVSVLLTRNAGAAQHIIALATFAQTERDIPPDAAVNLFIDDQDNGSLDATDESHFRFDDTQTAALIQALEHSGKIELALNNERNLLSSAGSSAWAPPMRCCVKAMRVMTTFCHLRPLRKLSLHRLSTMQQPRR